MGVSLEQYRARIGSYQQPAKHETSKRRRKCDDNPWRHATVTRTCNLLCSGDVEENPGPPIGRRDQMEILRHLLTELLSDAARTSAYQRLVRHVRQSGLKFRPDEKVPKDGNCMFHAISDQLLYIDGHVITHVQLRQGIVNYLRSNPSNDCGDHMRMYVADQDWDAYLASMSREGTWGDHIVLQAMATMLGRDIRIISSVESDNYEIVLSPRLAHLTRPPLLLGHLAENHYYSLAECKTKKSEGIEEDEPHYFDFHWDIDCLEEYRDGIITCPESHKVMPSNLVVPPPAVSNHYKPHGKAKEVSCKIGSRYRKNRAVEPDGSSSYHLEDDSSLTAVNPDHADDRPVAAPPKNMMAPDQEERSQEVGPGSSSEVDVPRKRHILLISTEYGTSHGGVSTINCQVAKLGTDGDQAVVSCTVLKAPDEDKKSAKDDHVHLITPCAGAGPRNSKASIDWLYYHNEHYPGLPDDVDCIIGHADVTDQAARKIKNDRYPRAKLISINHVIPEDTEVYKRGGKPMEGWTKDLDVVKEADGADVVFSVGSRIYDHFCSMYRGNNSPGSHQIFFPKPSDVFMKATMEAPTGGQLVVLSIGRVSRVEKLKGHDISAGSMGIVAETIKNVALRVRGIKEDDYDASKKILEDNLKSGKLKPTLLPFGTQEEICDDMKKAHLVLMPSRAEPFGLVGLEAIAAGIPVLISDQSGLADMIKDLIKKKKCHPDMRHRIVKTNVNESKLRDDAKVWAEKILDTLENIESEFEKAAEFKQKLIDSEYWKVSHHAFLQACGITAAHQ
ncbi:hypothetical protein Bbelb_261130 [Branchiostoma belcheri]|nr:hypothetical protein Bbelb_261130 [Branchiostoma belcheri]